jgi:transcription elongation GreA/GreB family factor
MAPADDRESLKAEAEAMRADLAEIERRIQELEKESE